MKPILLLLAVLGLAATALPAAGENKPMEKKTEYAVFGGGCFWCMEAVFERVPGVQAVVNGYAGGHVDHPTYEEVCSHTTGHAEVVQIEYDPAEVTYEHLLGVFWEAHDPTSLNRQGADEGPQYRSVIFYLNDAQKAAAEKSKAAVQGQFSRPIVTEIEPLKKFWRAEDYHQHYFAQHPDQGYCAFVIRPKVTKLQQEGVITK
jgi:peptide-methionine (S)-S-oxide reductase